HHAFDPGDAHGGEVGRCPPQEVGAGLGGLVVVDLAVGQAGVVIDHGVDVVIADAPGLVLGLVGRGASVGAPAAAVGDLAQLLHIHVDQLPGPGPLVAHGGGLGGADLLTGHRVQLVQVGHAGAAQHPGDGARGQTELGADPVRPAAVGASAVHDPLGHLGRCAPGAVVGAAGAVVQAVLALLVVALEPVVGALARDAHRLGGVGHRPPLLAYPTHQQQASLERQPGITVGHEDLRDLVVTLRQATPHPEVLLTSTNHRECHQRPGRVQLAGFFAALHQAADTDAPPNPVRGVSLAERAAVLRTRLETATFAGAADLLHQFDQLVTTSAHSGPPLWLHGDPHPLNLLAAGDQLTGVIDFGDTTAGDPATDLATAW